MIQLVLIVLVAMVALILILAGLAWLYLRGGSDLDLRQLRDEVPADDGQVDTLAELQPESGAVVYPMLDAEPGEEYAAELHQLKLAAEQDVLEVHLAWYPGRMPHWYAAGGGTLEQWERCYKWRQRRYWTARRQEWRHQTQEWWADYRAWRAEMGLAA